MAGILVCMSITDADNVIFLSVTVAYINKQFYSKTIKTNKNHSL